MSGLSYSKKKKCQGCKASKKDGNAWVCSLGIEVEFDTVSGVAAHPRPLFKCLKPKSDNDYNKLRRELKARGKQKLVDNEA
jgi:hypothetical protein